MDPRPDEKRERIEREIERLAGHIRSLDRDARGSKHVLWLALLALPVGVFVGVGAAFLVVLFTLALLATALYLIGVRRREYVGLIDDCKRDIARMETSAPRKSGA